MNAIVQQYDQPGKKGFDDSTIYRELEKEDSIRVRDSNDFYEYIAFLLAEYLPDRCPWGCLFGYRCAIGMSDGSKNEIPPENIISKEMVEFWENRIEDSVNPILKQRYTALVQEFKKTICGTKPDYKLRRMNVELIKTLIEEDYLTDEAQIAIKLHYAFKLLPSVQDISLVRTFVSTISTFIKRCPDKGWAIDACLDILYNADKLFKDEEKELWITLIEEKMESARVNKKVDAWRTFSHIKRLMKFVKHNQEKLLSYINDSISDFRISCGDNEMMLYGNLENVRDLCMEFDLREKAKAILLDMQNLAKNFGKYMVAHAIPMPYNKKRAMKIMELCMIEESEEAFENIVYSFIPSKDDAKVLVESEMKKSPLKALLRNQQFDQDFHPLSSTGNMESDAEGKIVEKYRQLLLADSSLLHDVIRENTGREVLSASTIMQRVSCCCVFKKSRHSIIKKGLMAYFDGDYVVAVHLLIPQVENAIRLIYEQNGGLVLKGHSYGLQLETLDNILKSEQIRQCFTDDGAFYLKNLLTDMRSCNYRNCICHGLMEESDIGYNIADRILHALLFICIVKKKVVE
jgi:hypothetical protein